jgi:hypothetical protein
MERLKTPSRDSLHKTRDDSDFSESIMHIFDLHVHSKDVLHGRIDTSGVLKSYAAQLGGDANWDFAAALPRPRYFNISHKLFFSSLLPPSLHINKVSLLFPTPRISPPHQRWQDAIALPLLKRPRKPLLRLFVKSA